MSNGNEVWGYLTTIISTVIGAAATIIAALISRERRKSTNTVTAHTINQLKKGTGAANEQTRIFTPVKFPETKPKAQKQKKQWNQIAKKTTSVMMAVFIFLAIVATTVGVYTGLTLASVIEPPDWKSSTTEPPAFSAWLTDLDYLNKHNLFFSNSEPKTNNGDRLTRGMYVGAGEGSIEYQLDKQYSKITGKFALDYSDKNSHSEGYLIILVDGVEAYRSICVTRGVPPVVFSVPIIDCQTIQLKIRGGNSFTLGDVALLK